MTLQTGKVGALLAVIAFLSSGCGQAQPPAMTAEPTTPLPPLETLAQRSQGRIFWQSKFADHNWRSHWHIRNQEDWGWQNTDVITDPTRKFPKVLRVKYPAGSVSPSFARKTGAPLGGVQFFATLGMSPQDSLKLSYYVYFSKDFDFVKGGKLPGLFGGKGNSGGEIPDGTDGFSTRFMWRKTGNGEVYAYLPTSRKHGTSIGRGKWQFRSGTWHHIEQQVDLNQANQKDGRIQVWMDGRKVLDKGKLQFRTTDQLKIDGILFSTFFGGSDRSWAPPRDVSIYFADFSIKKSSPSQ
jgi:hypothetical protein